MNTYVKVCKILQKRQREIMENSQLYDDYSRVISDIAYARLVELDKERRLLKEIAD